jgi:FkbM family methyltransferase
MDFSVFKDSPRDGVFVEVGAVDGVDGSNCHFFESEWGWDGICIEPNVHSFELLKENRGVPVFNCAITEEDGEPMDFCSITGGVRCLSGLVDFFSEDHKKRIDEELIAQGETKQIVPVPVRSLESLLDENKISQVDYLSIDCEGADFAVLKGLNFEKCNVLAISIEHNEYDSNNSPIDFLKLKGYSHVAKCCADNIFLKDS